MEYIFLVNSDFRAFDVKRLEELFRAESGIQHIRTNLPAGCPLEGEYGSEDRSTRIAVSEDATAITLSWTSTTALEAALIIRRGLGEDLRFFDTQYSFDLLLSASATVDDLTAAIDASRATK